MTESVLSRSNLLPTIDNLEALAVEQAALINQHNQLTAAIRADLDSLHVKLVNLKAVNGEIFSMPPHVARAVISLVDIPMTEIATAYSGLRGVAGNAGGVPANWEAEWLSGQPVER